MCGVHFVEVAAGVRPAGRLLDPLAVESLEPTVGIGLQDAGERSEVLGGMFAFAVRRVLEPDGGGIGPVSANVRP
jgi:hypothetical protein